MKIKRPITLPERCIYATMWLALAVVWGAILAETITQNPWGIQ